MQDENNTIINSILPDGCFPTKYSLNLTIFPHENELFYHVLVKIKCNQTSRKDYIVLNSVLTNYSIIDIKILYKKNLFNLTYTIENEYQESIRVKLDGINSQEDDPKFTLFFNVVGKIKEDKKALFYWDKNKKSKEQISNDIKIKNISDIVIANCFAPAEARFFIPCFDFPQFKSEFSLTIILSREFNGMHVISNTEKIKEELYSKFIQVTKNKTFHSHEENFLYSLQKYSSQSSQLKELNPKQDFLNDFLVHKFKKTPLMSIYLLNITIGGLNFKSSEVNRKNKPSVLIRVFYYKKEHVAELILKKAIEAFVFYEDYFNIEFPMAKLDLILLPNLEFSGMENWGSILFNSDNCKVSSKPSFGQISYISEITYHEVSHMWFGNLVTMKSFRDLWLNEGFASFMEFFATRKYYEDNNLNYWSHFLWKRGFFALNSDSNESRPMLVSDHEINPRNLEKIYDFVNYSKSSTLIFYALSIMGEDDFRKSINIYLNNFKYSNAKTEDILDIFDYVSKKNVKISMLDFLKNPSYPCLLLKRKNSHIYLEQLEHEELYSCFDENSNSLYFDTETIPENKVKTNKFWHIFLSILIIFKKDVDKESQVISIFLDNKSINLSKYLNENYKINSDEIKLVILNYDKFSYCRTIYDKEFLLGIIQELNYIKTSNKNYCKNILISSLINDFNHLSNNNKISIFNYLYLVQQLFNLIDINDIIPVSLLVEINRKLIYSFNPIYNQTLITPTLRNYGVIFQNYVRKLIHRLNPILVDYEEKLLKIDLNTSFKQLYDFEVSLQLSIVECEILENTSQILIVRKYLNMLIDNPSIKLPFSFKKFLLETGGKFNDNQNNYIKILNEFNIQNDTRGLEIVLRTFKYFEKKSLEILVKYLFEKENFINVLENGKVKFFENYALIHNLVSHLLFNFDIFYKNNTKICTFIIENFPRYIYHEEIYPTLFEYLKMYDKCFTSSIVKDSIALLDGYYRNKQFFQGIKSKYLNSLEKIV
jgi:hypothetical protein